MLPWVTAAKAALKVTMPTSDGSALAGWYFHFAKSFGFFKNFCFFSSDRMRVGPHLYMLRKCALISEGGSLSTLAPQKGPPSEWSDELREEVM